MISHVDIVGALVYRTREALNKPDKGKTYSDFYTKAIEGKYMYWNTVFDSPGKMHLWHYPGTPDEISSAWNVISKNENNSKLLFPCIFNFQSVDESYGLGSDGLVQIDLDLAIAAPVLSSWTTEQRNRSTHKLILEPIYDEFVRQIRKSGWFQIPMDGMNYNRKKVFTTGTSIHLALKTTYGWYFDTIQMTNFRLFLSPTICQEDIDIIEREAELVTDSPLFKTKE